MQEKKEKSTILVIFTIFILALFIILPPVFRKFFPKEEKKEKEIKKIDILSCSRNMGNEGYQIGTTTRYENNKIVEAKIIYTKVSETTNEATTIPNNITNEDGTINKELALFQSIPDIDLEETDTRTTVTLTEKIMESNADNAELASYFQPILEDQRTYYEDQNYICSFMTG